MAHGRAHGGTRSSRGFFLAAPKALLFWAGSVRYYMFDRPRVSCLPRTSFTEAVLMATALSFPDTVRRRPDVEIVWVFPCE